MDKIIIKGAREHNLKNIDLELPRNQLIVFTGLSGSGKSSLAFDTIYAEGQRRYVESLSSYARQFLGIMDKPDVDLIEGLSPSISIDQRSASGSPRSTVGTTTEIYDYLRVFFARLGKPHCHNCGEVIKAQTSNQIVDLIISFFKKNPNHRIMILAPLATQEKGEFKNIFAQIKKAGFVRVRINDEIFEIGDLPELDKNKKHSIDLVVDRLVCQMDDLDQIRLRLSSSVEQAIKWGKGLIKLFDVDEDSEQVYSELFACSKCGISLTEISPRIFSFNSPAGACPACMGLGTRLEVDPRLAIPNERLTLAEGAIRPWSRNTSRITWYDKVLSAVSQRYNFLVDVPVSELSKKVKEIILFGTGDEIYTVSGDYGRTFDTTFEGVVNNLQRRYKETDSEYIRKEIEKYMNVADCVVCNGMRLKPQSLAITIDDKSIIDMSRMSVTALDDYLTKLVFLKNENIISSQLTKEIKERLSFLINVGLGYITLDRPSQTLSGGEAQRIRLATQIGSKLTGVLYILDEPTVGLHPSDDEKLIATLRSLVDLGNTVLVVEHDEAMMKAADHLVEIGPGAGEHGGNIVSAGDRATFLKGKSLTAQYLLETKKINLPKERREGNGKKLKIIGASENNLKNLDVEIPLGMFVGITGVSGSGKSTLVNDILSKALASHYHNAKEPIGQHRTIKGLENLDKVISIDQSPIGRTPRSNTATYTGVFTYIRQIFSETAESRLRGYEQGRFSFNVKGGRCENCHGDGMIKIEMHFLPDVYVTCEHCNGKRYNREALEIIFKGKNISEILEMRVEEALEFFKNIPIILQKLKTLSDVGLEYIKLGQSATTLSGGEAQRIKLATELSRRDTGRTLYILDEPTTGLHMEDVNRLLFVLSRLVDKNNTVLVIEHNLHVIKCVDWIIDLGPEGGDKGGYVVAQGTPEQITKNKNSYTGKYLAPLLKKK